MLKSFPGRASGDPDNLLRDAPIACHELDLSGNVVWVNPAGCRLLGVPAEEIVGRHIWEFVAPQEREKSRAAVGRKLAGEHPLGVFERQYPRPDGSSLLLEIHDHYTRGLEGGMLGLRCYLLDIT